MGLTHARSSLESTTTLAHCTSLLAAIVALGLCAQAQAQSEVDKLRTGLRLNLGIGVVMGDLDFRSNRLGDTTEQIVVAADLGQIPSASLGLSAWINENAGFETSYQLGALGEVAVPLNVLLGQDDGTLALTHHRFSGAFLYRWFTGPRLTSWAFGLRAGFQLHSIIPSPHTPTIVLSTTYFGPELGATTLAPLTESLGLELDASLVLPFNVREFPDNSGVPDNPLGARLGLAPFFRLSDSLILKARYDLRLFNVAFKDTGTRGLGGVPGGVSNDLFHSAMLLIELIP